MSRNKSRLVNSLEFASIKDLEPYIANKTDTVKQVMIDVIINGQTYEKAGKDHGLTKHAIYDHLIRIYKSKFGKKYGHNKNRH